MSVDLLSMLLLVTLAQGLFILSVLVVRYKLRPTQHLFLFLLVIVLMWFQVEFLSVRLPYDIPVYAFYGTRFGAWLLLGPLFYFYVQSIAKAKGIKAGLVTFDSLKASAVSKVDVVTLNTVGLMFLKENNVGDAITIFKKNLASFPEQPLVYESYGEAMATTGNWTEAIKYYTQALSRDPGNMNAKEILRHIPK